MSEEGQQVFKGIIGQNLRSIKEISNRLGRLVDPLVNDNMSGTKAARQELIVEINDGSNVINRLIHETRIYASKIKINPTGQPSLEHMAKLHKALDDLEAENNTLADELKVLEHCIKSDERLQDG